MGRAAFLLVLAALFLAACGGGGPSEPDKGDVVVYVAVPLSGFQANGGQTLLGGVRLAAEEINRKGGLLGYRVVVRPLDDESDSDVARGQRRRHPGQRWMAARTVLGVIGHLNSGQTLAAMDLYKDMPLLVCHATASEQSLTGRGYTNFFRVNANDAVQARVDAQFLVDNLKAKRVAVLHNDTEYGRGWPSPSSTSSTQRGGQVAVTVGGERRPGPLPDEVAAVKAAAPDAIFYAGYEIETPYLRAELVEAGVTVPMLASDGAFLAATIDESNGTAEGMYVSAFAPSPRSVADDQVVRGLPGGRISATPTPTRSTATSAMQAMAEARRKGRLLRPQRGGRRPAQRSHPHAAQQPALRARRRPGGPQDLDLPGQDGEFQPAQ